MRMVSLVHGLSVITCIVCSGVPERVVCRSGFYAKQLAYLQGPLEIAVGTVPTSTPDDADRGKMVITQSGRYRLEAPSWDGLAQAEGKFGKIL